MHQEWHGDLAGFFKYRFGKGGGILFWEPVKGHSEAIFRNLDSSNRLVKDVMNEKEI